MAKQQTRNPHETVQFCDSQTYRFLADLTPKPCSQVVLTQLRDDGLKGYSVTEEHAGAIRTFLLDSDVHQE